MNGKIFNITRFIGIKREVNSNSSILCLHRKITDLFYKKVAFTLAEVLITLGIIGVVAAMTIPTLMTNYQKTQTISKLKQTYSMLSQALRLAEAENGDVGSWDFSQTSGKVFETYVEKHLKLSTKQHFKNQGDLGIVYKEISGRAETGLAMMRSNDGFNGSNIYFLNNGAQMIVSNTAGGNNITFAVDINGYQNPNQFGKDVFGFTIDAKHGLYLWGMYSTPEYTVPKEPCNDRNYFLKNSNNYRYECTKTGRGMFCGALIVADGWKIEKDYPW